MMSVQKSGPSGDEKYLQRFVASIGIFLILVSQLLVFSSPVQYEVVFPPYTWMTVLGALVFLSSRWITPTPFWKHLSLRLAPSRRVFWMSTAILFSILVAVSVSYYMQFTRINYIPLVTLWLLAAASYVYALSDGMHFEQKMWTAIKEHRGEIIAVFLVTLLAAALRLYKLGSLPRVMDGDEGLIGLNAQLTPAGFLANPFALWENIGALYLQAVNIMFEVFGVSLFSLRLLPAVGGILAIPAVYLFARQLAGQRIALLAAILLAISHAHIHFSRIASVAYIQGTWLVPLELFFLLRGLEQRKSWLAALGGLLLGIHFSVYLTAQIMVGVLLVYTAIALVMLRKWIKPALGPALAFWGGFLIMILPELVFIVNNPNEFLTRIGSDGTFQSGWLANTMAQTGRSAVSILFDRVVHAFMSLIYFPAVDFYGSSVPMLSAISTVLFLVGMVIALLRVRDPKYLLLNGYFWGATVAIGVFAIPPSADTYRMLIAIPPALIMAAIGLEEILGLLYLKWDQTPGSYLVGTGMVIVSLFAFNMWVYFGDFAGQCRYGGNLVSRFASYLGDHAGSADPDANIYLLSNTNYFYGSHASTDFLSGQHQIRNVPDPIDSVNPVTGDIIIAHPERMEELEIWVREHPGGRLQSRYDCRTKILLSYQVP